MTSSMRFGKRIPLPSTVEIKHELRLMAAADAILSAGELTLPETEVMAGEIAAINGLSVDRVHMLINRLVLKQTRSTTSVS